MLGPLLIASFILLVVGAVFVRIADSRYNDGTRKVDGYIKKTRILAVNGVTWVTKEGAITNALAGSYYAGGLGAMLGYALTRHEHYDNEFTFLVFYDARKQGNKREIEKVRQTSGRFQFLISKLEDESGESREDERPGAARAASSRTESLPAPQRRAPERVFRKRAPNPAFQVKTVTVPVGEYVVGQDIPAGVYALSADGEGTIWLYESESSESYSVYYDCKPDFAVGRIELKDGMKILINHNAIDFTMYADTEVWNGLLDKQPTKVLRGEYVVGQDIPPGSYTLTSDKEATIYLYASKDADTYDKYYECEEPDYIVGRVNLKDGMRIRINYGTMTFEPFRGLGFDKASE